MGSTHSSVKDKDNLFSYNVWSGTDYLKNSADFFSTTSGLLFSSTDWSINGDRCVKAVNSLSNSISCKIDNTDVVENDTVSFKFKIINNTGDTVYAQILQQNSDNTETQVIVSIPSSNNVQDIFITKNIDQEIIRVRCQISGIQPGKSIVADDFSLIKS